MIASGALEDVRARDPVERLLEDSWRSRSRRASRLELIVEGGAAALFLASAVPLAVPSLVGGEVRLDLALLLVGLYAVSLTVEFPIGAGYVVPSYLVLVPMLLLLPPEAVPLLVAISLVLGTVAQCIAHRAAPRQILSAIPNAWHALGPAVVLSIAGSVHGAEGAVIYTVAFLAGCLVDLLTSTLRESLALSVALRVQLRVIVQVWLVDACLAPIGLLAVDAARDNAALLLLLLPLMGLLVLANRDRSARIAEAQRRLDVVAHQRTRLQSAVYRLGDATSSP
jgi:hypothetical protein